MISVTGFNLTGVQQARIDSLPDGTTYVDADKVTPYVKAPSVFPTGDPTLFWVVNLRTAAVEMANGSRTVYPFPLQVVAG